MIMVYRPGDPDSPTMEIVGTLHAPRVGDQIEHEGTIYEVASVLWSSLELTRATVVLR